MQFRNNIFEIYLEKRYCPNSKLWSYQSTELEIFGFNPLHIPLPVKPDKDFNTVGCEDGTGNNPKAKLKPAVVE